MINFKFIQKVIVIQIFLITILPNICFGQTITGNMDAKLFDQTDAFVQKSGFEYTTEEGIALVVAKVIQAFLGLLGIIFVVLIVIAGNKWMNARGNEEKVEEAQDTIRRAIIGLIITVSAYAITYFVFSNLP